MLFASGCGIKIPDLPPAEKTKPQLTQELKQCKSWPSVLWNNDQELAKYIAAGRLAYEDCKLKHGKMVELYLKEFE